MDEKKLYTVAEVALILRVKKSYVYELIDTRRLGAVRLSARRFRVPSDSLETFIQTEIGRNGGVGEWHS